MGLIFRTLYVYIANLGILVTSIFTGFFKLILKGLQRLFKFNKTSFSSAKTFFKRSIAFVLIFSVIGASVLFLVSNDGKTDAFAVKIGGETVGYAGTQNDADHANSLALNYLGLTANDGFETQKVKTEPYNIKSSDVLSEEIIKKIAPDLIPVTEIYIDNQLLCAVKSRQEAREIFYAQLENAQKQYPNSSVSFAQEITFCDAYYNKDDTRIWSIEQLNLNLKTLSPLEICHANCEKTVKTVEYDTIEIQTNTLFIGDTRTRREGTDGSAYAIDLVTYIGDKKVSAEKLMSVSVKAPVSQIIERGIRAESLSLGTYSVLQTTGYFCWPVVGLFTVTSPFGYRSLGYHRGIDISGANASGSLVVAGASGTVTQAGWSTGGYGNYVVIDHGNGVETLYAHMLDNSIMVNPGDTVTKGQAIGRVGNTGYSFGAHLHFEVRINGNRLNPAPYLGLE
ncbi:MAG: M23 family metallopeptidase [Acutalibacteraceae bacterium]